MQSDRKLWISQGFRVITLGLDAAQRRVSEHPSQPETLHQLIFFLSFFFFLYHTFIWNGDKEHGLCSGYIMPICLAWQKVVKKFIFPHVSCEGSFAGCFFLFCFSNAANAAVSSKTCLLLYKITQQQQLCVYWTCQHIIFCLLQISSSYEGKVWQNSIGLNHISAPVDIRYYTIRRDVVNTGHIFHIKDQLKCVMAQTFIWL